MTGYNTTCHIFTAISRYNPTKPGLRLYCAKIKEFLQHKAIKKLLQEEFIKAYEELEVGREKKELEKQIANERTKIEMKAKVVGLKRVGEGLDEELVQTTNKKKSRQDVAEEEKGETPNEEKKKRNKRNPMKAMQKKQAVEKLAYSEEKIMKSGFSYLLDIVVTSENGQKRLFKDDEWERLETFFKENLSTDMRQSFINTRLKNIWSLVVKSNRSGGLTKTLTFKLQLLLHYFVVKLRCKITALWLWDKITLLIQPA
ncbi:hypothetical protein INT45_007025 [Circinella minor]|uniref:Uncharacterized protein n=1 Tax=Circinella minor TaxID=1195481 RepID=A0A8H7VQH4_9FUNG|nr:hypothetical protein INT45_007025 [Circinella minor]